MINIKINKMLDIFYKICLILNSIALFLLRNELTVFMFFIVLSGICYGFFLWGQEYILRKILEQLEDKKNNEQDIWPYKDE